ncbi:hypothetical protein [Aneurinibacillus tyrosinisolvens]|uniref:hypothetical protein n=1 Tax=Aneurinibacillus tyrosinisolvens TaxID=1443435 RepID=UPI00063F18A3|nr:hypothetical protein [Aneurinibacillus tyrosinisolvens]
MAKINEVRLTEAEMKLIEWLREEMFVDTLLDIHTGIQNEARELARLAQGALKKFPDDADKLAIRSAKMHQFTEIVKEVSIANINRKS